MIVVLTVIEIERHLATVRADHRRERLRIELEPVFSRFLEHPKEIVAALTR